MLCRASFRIACARAAWSPCGVHYAKCWKSVLRRSRSRSAVDGPRLWAEECQRELDPELRRKPVVVICQKEVRLWLENAETEHRWYSKIPRPGVALPSGIALEHYNAIAGLDDHKAVRLLVTI